VAKKQMANFESTPTSPEQCSHLSPGNTGYSLHITVCTRT